MLTSLSTNFNRRNKDVRLYEIGNIYLPKALPLIELPDERTQFTLGFYGDGDFYDMKGAVEEFFEKTGLKKKLRFDASASYPFLHPGRKAAIVYDGECFGYIGEVHPLVCKHYAIKDRVYVACIDLAKVLPLCSTDRKYEPVANFPAATRDLSMVVPSMVTAGQIEEIFDQKGGAYLESYRLFDIYEGAQVISGHKSMAYSLVFRAKDRNLSDDDVNQAVDRILKALQNLGIELRK